MLQMFDVHRQINMYMYVLSKVAETKSVTAFKITNKLIASSPGKTLLSHMTQNYIALLHLRSYM